MGPSAALTPAIWDKTIPYDGENFHLEYMDLEEFLMENGIPNLPEEDSSKSSPGKTEVQADKADAAKVVSVPTVALLPIDELDSSKKEVVIITKSDSDIICDVTTGKSWNPGWGGVLFCLLYILQLAVECHSPTTSIKWTAGQTAALMLLFSPLE